MKKKFLCMMLSAMLVLSMGACSGEKTDEHNHEHEVVNTESERAGDINLKIGFAYHEDNVHYLAAESFADEVWSRTNGEVGVTIYGSEKMGTDRELIKGMTESQNKVDIIISSVSNFTAIDARMDISSLPFLFKSHEEAWGFMDGDVQTEIEKNLINKNIRVLSHYSGGFEGIITSEAAVSEVSVMPNLKLITDDESEQTLAMRGLGAQINVLEPANVAQELQQGDSDGYYGKLTDIYNNSYYQGKGYLTMTYHSYEGIVFAIAENVWSSLSEEHQKIIGEAAVHSAKTDRENVRQQENNMVERIQAAGVRVEYPDLTTFRKSIQPIIKGIYTRYGNLVDRVISQNYMQ